jgi:predicted ribosome quality control (RQC) complex YloA/Tae2 family protein
MKTCEYNGVLFTLGKNAVENWEIFDKADPDHYFFHLSAFPSGYVYAATDSPTHEHITFASSLCKFGTKYKSLKDIKVDYCTFSNLEKGPTPGMVIFKSKRKVSTVKV